MTFETTTSNIKQLLKGHNLQQLADKSGVSLNTIQNWCYGKVQPTVTNLSLVLEAAGYSLLIIKKEDQ